ncbi:MAG: TerB family tellurite resistance protein, partial [Deltaproteobacteria bacterium]|nr:TerB family tellurite resistance protein [Deltaproteobacteria bacterium]
EEKQIETLLQHTFGLPQAAVREIKEQSDNRRHESIDLWQFTNTIKDHYGPAEKEKVIEMVWQVVYADGTLDQHEDYLVHKLARLLSINHKRLIAAKVKVLKEKKQA